MEKVLVLHVFSKSRSNFVKESLFFEAKWVTYKKIIGLQKCSKSMSCFVKRTLVFKKIVFSRVGEREKTDKQTHIRIDGLGSGKGWLSRVGEGEGTDKQTHTRINGLASGKGVAVWMVSGRGERGGGVWCGRGEVREEGRMNRL